MRSRVKILLVLAVGIIFVLVMYSQHLPSHHNIAKLHQLITQRDLASMWSVSNPAILVTTSNSDKIVPPLNVGIGDTSKHMPLKILDWKTSNTLKTMDSKLNTLSKSGHRKIDDNLRTLDSIKKYPTLLTINESLPQSGPVQRALEDAKETLQLQIELEKAATPANFEDIPKIGVKPPPMQNSEFIKRMRKKILKQVHTSSDIGEQYNKNYMKERTAFYSTNSSVGLFLAEQRRRSVNVKRQCALAKKRLRTGRVNLMDFEDTTVTLQAYGNLLLDRDHRLTFCPVYKAASTSWSVLMLQMRGLWKDNNVRNSNLQQLLHQIFPRLSSIAGSILTSNTLKFLIVRHPLERLLSCYRDKYEHAKKTYYYQQYGEKMVRHFRPKPNGFTSSELSMMLKSVREAVDKEQRMALPGNPYAHPVGPTFSEFAQFVVATRRDDEHWRPYYKHCATCFIDYDVVLKFEHLYDESRLFIEFLNKSTELVPRWDNPSDIASSTNSVACTYYGQLTVEQITPLLSKYAHDFLMYEYSADEYVKCAKDYKPGVKVVVQPSRHFSNQEPLVDAVR